MANELTPKQEAFDQPDVGGRPLKFETSEQLFGNGDYVFEGKKLAHLLFVNEKALSAYIVSNITEIFRDVFDDEVLSFAVDKEIVPSAGFGPRRRRVDLLVRCKKHLYVIELKNPKQEAENRSAIGQVLDYGREFPDPSKKLVVITTMFDENTAKTIQHYKLPIKYYFLYHGKMLEFKGFSQ